MAGLLEALMRRAAPGAYTETPEEQYRKSVMSPDYVPETSNRQPLYGSIRGLLDATPAGFLDAAQAGLNRLPTAGGALVRAVTGRAQGPTDAAMNLLGMQGSGPGYEAGRAASGAALAGMGLLGNQAGGQLPRGYARDQSGAIVWHGSPHKFAPEPGAPFGRFKADKIGTGEGAQAYGMGHYTAGERAVGKTYAENLSNRDMTNQGRLNAHANAQRLAKVAGDPKYAADDIRFALEVNPEHAQQQLLRDTLKFLESGDYAKPLQSAGSLYKIDLPDEQIAKMLDWDKPLSQQSEAVRNSPLINELIEKKRQSWSAFSKADQDAEIRTWLSQTKGEVLASEIAFLKGGDRQASQAMRDAGIPGIRYLDGGSRTAGAGSSNYVVFPGNEGLLKILGRE